MRSTLELTLRGAAAQLANTSVAENRGPDSVRLLDIHSGLAAGPAGEDRLVVGRQTARRDQGVGSTRSTELGVAGRLVAGGHGEGLTGGAIGEEGSVYLVEDVALNEGLGAGANVEGVAGVVEPVVVVGVPVAVELELGRAPRGVVDVVASEGHLVILAITETERERVVVNEKFVKEVARDLHSPIVVTIA